MTPATFLLLALTFVVAFVDWAAVATGKRRLEYVAKPLTMVVLMATALALDPVDDAVRVAFVVALVFCLVGDVFLMLPNEKLFVFGLGSFLVGHLAYVVGLQLRGQTGAWFVAGLVVVVVAVLTLGRRIVGAVKGGDDPSLTVPVTAYIGVISLMVASAFGTRNVFAIGGAALFYASDALIAWNRFVHTYPWGRVAIITTYHLGQIGLVLSLV